MTLTTMTDGAKATIAIAGWLNAKTAPAVAKALEALDSNIAELVMDCAELEYISSAGLRQFVVASRKTGGHLTIMNASTDVKAILDMSCVTLIGRIV